MNYKEHTRLDLVAGGNVFKQGDHMTLGFTPRNYEGDVVDLTGKDIEGVIYSRRKGIMFTAPADYVTAEQKIEFTIDEVLDHGEFQIEFTVTDAADPEYRRKFPSAEQDGRLIIKPSADNMDVVGVQMTTVSQLKNELQGLQSDFESSIVPQVDELKQRVDDGVGAFTEDTEVLDARMGEPNLRAFNEKLTTQLAETDLRIDNVIATAGDGTVPSEVTDMRIVNNQTFTTAGQALRAIADGTALKDNVGTTEKIAPRAVNKSKLNFAAITGTPSKNLFDKHAVYSGKYVRYQDGALADNESYAASDYIAIKPNTTYTPTVTDQLAFKDSNYEYISGLGLNTYTSFTTPANAAYVQVSVPKNRLDVYQLEEGEEETNYVSANAILSENSLETFTKEKINKPSHLLRVMNHLENPFIKTKIKLLGDSITAGVGGTGWSATGDPIPGTVYNQSLTTSVSWANKLYEHIVNGYNKEHYIAPNNPNVEITRTGTNAAYVEPFSLCFLQFRMRFFNFSATGKGAKFRFYGDHAQVLYMKKTNTGKFLVRVDGVDHGVVDTYDTATSYGNVYNISGLSEGEHVLEVLETGERNGSSSAWDIYIEGFRIPKVATVENYAISGRDSRYYNENKATLIEADDDIILMQLGTNDRKYNSPDVTKGHQREIIKYAHNMGVKVILMCANPVVVEDDNTSNRIIKMNDINTALRQLADEFGMEYISNYDWFLEYSRTKGIPLQDLLDDLLHPNDEGYQVMFDNIARRLGLSIVQEGIVYS